MASHAADRLDWTQRGELFLKGTVTDEKTHQTWDIILVPGIFKISDDAANGWKDLAHSQAELGSGEFWSEVGDTSADGLRFSKDVIANHWIGGIVNDFHEAIKAYESVTPGEIGSGFERVASWAWFGIKVIGRTAWAPVGSAGGVAYSIVAPAASIVLQTAGNLVYDGALRGAAVPAVLYVWNGVAWVGDSFGNVPTKESFFVHLEYQDPQTGEAMELVIDQRGFETLVKASVLETMTDQQKAALQAKIDATEAQIQKLVQEQDQAGAKLQASPEEQALQDLLSQAMQSSQVKMSADAQTAFLDSAKLRDVVTKYLISLGVSNPDPKMVDAILQKIGNTLQQMNVEMGKTAATPPSPTPAQTTATGALK